MLEQKLKIKNKSGLHARPASMIVREATKFSSDISIIKDANVYNARSIMNVMSMGAKYEEEIILKVSGVDEKEAISTIARLIEDGFGEV